MDEKNVFDIRDLFSRNLKRLRAAANISQLTLASMVDLSHNFINDIENGKKWASAETVGRLATALRAEPYQFFLSESRWNDEGSNILSAYLDDLQDSFFRMVSDYRRRYIEQAENKTPHSVGGGISGLPENKNHPAAQDMHANTRTEGGHDSGDPARRNQA